MSLLPEITLLADLIEGRLCPMASPDGMPALAPDRVMPPDEDDDDSDVPKPTDQMT